MLRQLKSFTHGADNVDDFQGDDDDSNRWEDDEDAHPVRPLALGRPAGGNSQDKCCHADGRH